MINKLIIRFSYIIFIIISSCAVIVTPTGGGKDTVPPKILKEDPANNSINFNYKKITILFDEYVQAKNIRDELIISPPFEKQPDIQVIGKKLVIKFEDTLKKNTTYNFQFGESIVDINEGNPLSDYQYIFGTGEYLDSLQVSGNVIDAFTLEPVSKVKILVHNDSCDSCIYKSKPIYFSRSRKEGNFEIISLKYGRYDIYALEDKNNNYILDQGERIGFLDSIIEIDTFTPELTMKIFKQKEHKTRILDYEAIEFGKMFITFNNRIDSIRVEQIFEGEIKDIEFVSVTKTNDTVLVWFEQYNADSLNFRYRVNEMDFDTLTLMNAELIDSTEIDTLKKIQVWTEIDKTTKKAVFISFSEPLVYYKSDRIRIYEDTILVTKDIKIKFTDSSRTVAVIRYKLNFGKDYRIIYLDSCFHGIRSKTNDTIEVKFRTKKEAEIGLISIRINIEKSKSHIIIELLDSKGEISRTKIIEESQEIAFDKLLPGNYRIRFIEDQNANKVWDTGDFDSRILPEEVHYYMEKIELKANWEIVDLNFTIP